jgi:hypothetical protein
MIPPAPIPQKIFARIVEGVVLKLARSNPGLLQHVELGDLREAVRKDMEPIRTLPARMMAKTRGGQI